MIFPVHNLDTAPSESIQLMQQTQQNFGFIPNLIGVMSTSPALTEAYLRVADIFSKSSLSPTEQQIVLLTVSAFHGCDYCVAAHTAIAGMQQVDQDVIQAIRNDQLIADPKLQSLREFTHSLVSQRACLDTEIIESFLRAGYQEVNIFEILVGIAQKTLSNYTNHLANTPLDDVFQELAWKPAS